ncbi:DUF7288 family protein [Halorussus amylolyticus]|uniref:DUF7288 family protein n=1 Tax=Halorussus amylolyticus TaxID=1126242 RepID=UPI0010494659|nr:hypothetical protein [Halorussus amylolyticus]
MDRGQAHTLEAFTAALVVVSGVIFALQATAVTPLTASTSNQHIENQHQEMARGLLASEAENGTLREALVHWNVSEESFVESPDRGYFANRGPPNAFGDALDETFGDAHVAYNVRVRYRTPDNRSRTETMVYMGSPSDNAVTATRTVVLYDDDSLVGPDDDTTVGEADAEGDFYAPDAAPDGPVFNVVGVEVVVWRM